MRMIAGTCCLFGLLMLAAPVRSAEEAGAKAIIAKAIEAHGGADNIKKHKTSVVKTKGKFYGMGEGIDYTGTTSIQMPDRNRMEVEMDANGMKLTFIRVYDGAKGWQSFNGMATDLGKEMIAEGQEQQYSQSVERLIPLTEKEYKLSSLGESKVGDRPTVGVKVEREGHRPIKLYFDKEKNLLLKSETNGKDPMNGDKEYKATKLFDNYKKVEGLMVAHKVTLKHDDKDFVKSEVTEVKLPEKLDDALFAKP